METAQSPSVNEWIKIPTVKYYWNIILKDEIPSIYDHIDGPGAYYAVWNKQYNTWFVLHIESKNQGIKTESKIVAAWYGEGMEMGRYRWEGQFCKLQFCGMNKPRDLTHSVGTSWLHYIHCKVTMRLSYQTHSEGNYG